MLVNTEDSSLFMCEFLVADRIVLGRSALLIMFVFVTMPLRQIEGGTERDRYANDR